MARGSGERIEGARAGEPLGLRVTPLRPDPDPRLHLSFQSRGDRVGLRLQLPSGAPGPLPCLLLPRAARDPAEAHALDAATGAATRAGLCVASLDLPLHGARAGGKRPARLEPLLPEIARQSASDLARGLDALGGLPQIDPQRIGYAGLGLAAWVGAALWGADPRLRAGALAPWGAGFGDAAVSALAALRGARPRPLLVLHAGPDDDLARRLLEAAPEPRRAVELPASPERSDAPPAARALDAMADFLSAQLARPNR